MPRETFLNGLLPLVALYLPLGMLAAGAVWSRCPGARPAALAMLPWTLGWAGRWLPVSPIGHRIHHSPLPEHQNRNFSTCPFWDRLFGPWYEGPLLNEAVGLDAPAPTHPNLVRQRVADLRELCSSAASSSAAGRGA